MILNDGLIDRVHLIEVAALAALEEGVRAVRGDTVGTSFGTGFALFAGEGSPLTQAYGVGHRASDDPSGLDRFYEGRCENWEVTVTPFTSRETSVALQDLGYRFSHFEGLLAQEVGDVADSGCEIVEVGPNDLVWMETTWRGWTGVEGGPAEPDELVRAVASGEGPRRYLAYVDGVPAATANMNEIEEAVLLGGAATRVPFRGRGLQSALLTRRLADAGKGRFALIGAVPGTASHRNAQRAGFQPLYSTAVWMRRP